MKTGITLGTLVICYADPLIALTGCVPELIATASSYLKVRAIGQPVVLAAMVIQSGLMAQLDTVTPLQVILRSVSSTMF
jgi:Na+-driven multidrug efflux pump